MATKAFKSEKIDAIKAKAEKAQVAILTEYKGYSVEEITNLRRSIQKEGGDYMVTKNTLAKIAFKGTDFEVLTEALTGPVAIAFGFEDQVSPAKAVAKFIKDTKKELNRLEIRKKNRSIWEKIQKHKIISFTIIALIMFSCLNFFLIYNFMKVLQNI